MEENISNKQLFDTITTQFEYIKSNFATNKSLDKFATKDDLNRFATKDDLNRFATKDDLNRFATKDDLNRFATKDDLNRFATKDDLEDLAAMVARGFEQTTTKNELNTLREELKNELTEVKSDLTQTIYKEVGRLDRRLDQMALRSELQNVEKRVTRLERKTA